MDAAARRGPGDALPDVDRAVRAGRLDAAAALCEAALAGDRRDHRLHNARAVVARATGSVRAAARSYARAIALAPSEAVYYVNFANALIAADRPRMARRLVLTALRLCRDDAGFQLVLAECLRCEQRFDEAAAVLAPLADARPFDARVRHAEGMLLLGRNLHRRSAAAFSRCLALAPDHARACMNLATALRSLGDADRAIGFYEAALRRAPGDVSARYLRACTLLSAGRLGEGWDAYEGRWRFPGFSSPRRRTPRPAWDGVARPETRLLVWPEQGVGDLILFAGCLPDLLRTGQPVILECDPRLVPLFRHSFPAASVRAVTHDGSGRERLAAPDYDVQLPIGSLARLYRRSLADFPCHGGYLRPPRGIVERWRRAVAQLGGSLKVGVAWRSGDMRGDRAGHYAPLDAWQPIFSVPDVTFVNLQYGMRPDERAAIRERFGVDLVEWAGLDLKDDFADVAGILIALDLVVTGPSATAFQAGSVGRLAWVIDGPSVSFKYHGTDEMPWFPSWRPFRKHDHAIAWDGIFGRLGTALRTRAAASG